jgi:hypothetical protein
MSDSRARRPDGRPSGGGIQHLKLKLAVLLIVCALPLFGSLSMWLRGISLVPLTLMESSVCWRFSVLGRQAQGPRRCLAHAGEHPACAGTGRRLARGADCPAGVPAQDAQGVVSDSVLGDCGAASGVLDRPAVSGLEPAVTLLNHPIPCCD